MHGVYRELFKIKDTPGPGTYKEAAQLNPAGSYHVSSYRNPPSAKIFQKNMPETIYDRVPKVTGYEPGRAGTTSRRIVQSRASSRATASH